MQVPYRLVWVLLLVKFAEHPSPLDPFALRPARSLRVAKRPGLAKTPEAGKNEPPRRVPG